MSVTVSTPNQICRAPTNTSPSKQLTSFSKANRFPKPSKDVCVQFVYDLPPAATKRTTSFGYGTKYDFTRGRGRDGPAPNAYPVFSDFSRKHPFSSSYTFGISREESEKRYVPGHSKADPEVPGPGTYVPLNPIGADALKFTMRPNLNRSGSLFKVNNNPGPGTYAPKTETSSNGRYFVSTFRTVGAYSFSPKRSERFLSRNKNMMLNPGPGTYRPKVELTQNGKYFVSHFESSKCRTFSHSRRELFQKRLLNTPGPGTYRLPSDFGYYEARRKPISRSRSFIASEQQ